MPHGLCWPSTPATYSPYPIAADAEGRKSGRVAGVDSAEADRDAADLPSKFRDTTGQPAGGVRHFLFDMQGVSGEGLRKGGG